MVLKIFTQPGCPACPPAKALAEKLEKKIKVDYIDVSKPEGLEEALKYSVMSTPTLILIDKKVEKIWTVTPSEGEVLQEIERLK